jgi:hypothetical protein
MTLFMDLKENKEDLLKWVRFLKLTNFNYINRNHNGSMNGIQVKNTNAA